MKTISTHHRRGGALIEAVLVLSLILMLSLGAAEYGYAFFLKHTLQAAANVAVRTAIMPGSTDAAVQAAVTKQMALSGMQRITYTLTTVPASVANCPSGTSVSVTIACTWGDVGITPLSVAMGGLAADKQISAAGSMVHE